MQKGGFGYKVIATFTRAMSSINVPPTNSGAKSPHRSQDSESLKKILTYFWGVRLPPTYLSQKSPQIGSFLFKSVLKLELWNINNFLLKFWSFWDMI